MKALKKFFVLLVSAILSLGVCLFGACNAGGGSSSIDDSDKYVIYVMKDGEGVEGVGVSLCLATCPLPTDTDENGRVIFEGTDYPIANYHITISQRDIPVGYKVEEEKYTGTSYGTFTIELVAE